MGVHFADFIAPGLIVMAMIQNAFANSSFSLLVGKIQGNIVDYLMPPLSTGELIAGLVGASVTRAFLVGFAVWLAMLLWPGVSVDGAPARAGPVVRADGLAAAVVPRPADLDLGREVRPCRGGHQFRGDAAVAAVRHLLFGPPAAPAFQAVSHANPFFYVISGFRAGFLGVSDSPLWVGGLGLLVLNVVAVGGLLSAAQERLEDQELSNFQSA